MGSWRAGHDWVTFTSPCHTYNSIPRHTELSSAPPKAVTVKNSLALDLNIFILAFCFTEYYISNTFPPAPNHLSLCYSFFKIYFFLIGVYLLYNVSFCCTTMWIHTSPPSLASLPTHNPSHPSRSSQNTELSSLRSTASSHLVFYTW